MGKEIVTIVAVWIVWRKRARSLNIPLWAIGYNGIGSFMRLKTMVSVHYRFYRRRPPKYSMREKASSQPQRIPFPRIFHGSALEKLTGDRKGYLIFEYVFSPNPMHASHMAVRRNNASSHPYVTVIAGPGQLSYPFVEYTSVCVCASVCKCMWVGKGCCGTLPVRHSCYIKVIVYLTNG